MADTKQPARDAAAAGPATAGPGIDLGAPGVSVETKKRKRRYSDGLEDAQRLERGVAKASRRLSRAIAEGLDTYYKRREESSYKRRDGAVRDALKNASRAASKTLREVADVPNDIFSAFNSRSIRNAVRDAVRRLPVPFGR